MGKAYRIPSSTDRLRKQQISINNLQAQLRNRNTPRAVAATASSGSSAAGSSGGTGNFLPLGGGTLTGNIAFDPDIILVSNGRVDLGTASNTSEVSTNILVTGQGTPDDIRFIDGAQRNGQLLLYQGTNQQIQNLLNAISFTITNIVSIGGSNIITVTVPSTTGLSNGDNVDISLTTNFNKRDAIVSNLTSTTFTYDLGEIGSSTAETAGTVQTGNIFTNDGNTIVLDGTLSLLGAPRIILIFDNTIFAGGGWRPAETVGSSGGTSNPTYKAPVRVATISNGILASAFENGDVIDGVTLVTGNRILLKDQSTGTENGIYIVSSSGTPTRAADFAAGLTNVAASQVTVEEGTVNKDLVYIITTNNPTIVGTTALVFVSIIEGAQTPWKQDIDAATFDVTNLDKVAFKTSPSTDTSLNVGFSSLGSGGFKANVLNDGKFQITEEDILHFSFEGLTNTINVINSGFIVKETITNDQFSIAQSAALTTITATDLMSFFIGAVNILDITDSGLVMKGTNFIITPQLGFPILGNIITVDDGGMIFKTPVGDDFKYGDGTDVFATLDKDLFALQFASIQIPKIAVPSDPGINTAGKVFYSSVTNRISVRRRNDANTAFETVILEQIPQTPWKQDIDAATFDVTNLDKVAFKTSPSTGTSLNVGFSSLGNGGFKANVLNDGKFDWTEEDTLLMRLSETSSVTSLSLTGILSSRILFTETTTSKTGSIQQGTSDLQITCATGTDIGFLVGVESVAKINSSGILMQGTNFITTPQIGFSILGNIIEDDANGMKLKTPVGNSFEFSDGTSIFASLDKTLFALQFASIQIPKIAVPSDPGINTAGKVFYSSVTNRISARRRNDANTAFETVILEGGGEINTASNVGAAANVFKQKVGVDLEFRTLVGGTDIQIVQTTDILTINYNGPAAGEINTASNVGTGVGKIFKQKVGVNLQLKSILAGSGITTVNGTDDVQINAIVSENILNDLGNKAGYYTRVRVYHSTTPTTISTVILDSIFGNYSGATGIVGNINSTSVAYLYVKNSFYWHFLAFNSDLTTTTGRRVNINNNSDIQNVTITPRRRAFFVNTIDNTFLGTWPGEPPGFFGVAAAANTNGNFWLLDENGSTQNDTSTVRPASGLGSAGIEPLITILPISDEATPTIAEADALGGTDDGMMCIFQDNMFIKFNGIWYDQDF